MPSSVEHAYRRHAGMVRRALRSFGVDAAALDDAVQDVFVVLVRRRADFDARGSWTNWVWGIARRVARGYRRGAGRRERLHAILPREVAATTPEDELGRRRALAFLDGFVRDLPPALLETFVLVELEGRTGPEVAAATGVNLNTVYARIRAVRRRFDEAIAAELAPARTGAFGWLGLASWWTPVATTAVVVLVFGRAADAPESAPAAPAVASAPVLASPTIAAVTPALPSTVEDEIEIEDDPPPEPRPRRAKPRRAHAPSTAAPRGGPALQPDEERVIVLRPTPTRMGVRPKSDFVSELRTRAPGS